jgi:hypothetical protein
VICYITGSQDREKKEEMVDSYETMLNSMMTVNEEGGKKGIHRFTSC